MSVCIWSETIRKRETRNKRPKLLSNPKLAKFLLEEYFDGAREGGWEQLSSGFDRCRHGGRLGAPGNSPAKLKVIQKLNQPVNLFLG